MGHGNDQDLKTPTLVQGLADRVVTKVVAGWAHSLALTGKAIYFFNQIKILISLYCTLTQDTNEVFSWGWNEQGQCGQVSINLIFFKINYIDLDTLKIRDSHTRLLQFQNL